MSPEQMLHSWVKRLLVLTAAIVLPCMLFARGILGSFLFTFSIPVIVQCVIRGRSLADLGLKRWTSWRPLIVGVMSGCVMGVAGGVLVKAFGIPGQVFTAVDSLRIALGSFTAEFSLQQELGYRLLMQSNTLSGMAVYFLFSVVLIGLGEELFWRGLLLRSVMKRLSTPYALGIVSILFAASHCYLFSILSIPAGLFLMALIGGAGLCWGIMAVVYDSLVPSAVSHGIAALILWKYFFFTSS